MLSFENIKSTDKKMLLNRTNRIGMIFCFKFYIMNFLLQMPQKQHQIQMKQHIFVFNGYRIFVNFGFKSEYRKDITGGNYIAVLNPLLNNHITAEVV